MAETKVYNYVSVKIGGNAPSNPFSVRVVNLTTVDEFKELVKGKKQTDLNGIDAHHLEVSSLQSIYRFHIMHLIGHIFICIGLSWYLQHGYSHHHEIRATVSRSD